MEYRYLNEIKAPEAWKTAAKALWNEDDPVPAAHREPRSARRAPRRWIAAAAAACLLLLSAVPALAAADNGAAYDILYAVFPAMAQRLKPVHAVCEDQGIRMEVVFALITGDSAQVLLTLTDTAGSRLDDTTDLFDSYRIHTPFDCCGTCTALGYDEATGTAAFLVSLTQTDGEPIPGDKVTFSVDTLLYGKEHHVLTLDGIDLSALPEDPPLREHYNARGMSGDTADAVSVLEPQDPRGFSLADGCRVTACGLVDGRLHVQALYENITETDDHGFVYLLGPEGERILPEAGVSFWSDAGRDSFEEYVFDVPPELLPRYTLGWEVWTCAGALHGSWQVTVPLAEEQAGASE